MTGRIIAAVVRLELLRSRRVTLWSSALAVAATIAALTLDGSAAITAGFVVGITVMATVMFAPMSSLLVEKLLGILELDRTLPVPIRTLATARLLAAAVRTTPLLLLLVVVASFVAQQVPTIPTVTLVFSVIALQTLYWCLLWIGYGMLVRFDFKKLMWVPAAMWFTSMLAPHVLTGPMKRAVAGRVTSLVSAALADPARLPPLGLAVLGVAVLCFGVALALVSDGLRRFQPDPLALQGVVEKVPREELTPVRRGVVVAILRLRLRLVTPQFRRELLIVGVMVAVLLADASGFTAVAALAGIARAYLPVLAFLMPGAVGLHLLPARQLGTLEGLQQLPFPRRDIALGHLLTIQLLVIPAVVIWVVARTIEGGALDAERIFRVWAFTGAASWLLASLAVWATTRRMLIAGSIVIGGPLLLYFGGGWLLPKLGVDVAPQVAAMFRYGTEHAAWLKPAASGAAFVAAVAIGLAMFTHGLRTYQPKAP